MNSNRFANNIVVVCDDNSIIQQVNSFMCRSGVLTITDLEGKTRYLVDGRESRAIDSESIDDIIMSISSVDKRLNLIIEAILSKFGFNFALIGTRIYADMIKDCAFNMDVSRNMKSYYKVEADRYSMTIVQIERDVRYAITNSSIPSGDALPYYISKEDYERILMGKHKTKNLLILRIIAQIALDRYNSTN
ncbi:MAG: sporulation initiation factor Spo0A C-terminal domain-containing protein [Clostridia bacterium]|nr:sporulation initiation factor Spo0A C-terminal domain-containing protein [Clostridia bacterium]